MQQCSSEDSAELPAYITLFFSETNMVIGFQRETPGHVVVYYNAFFMTYNAQM